MSDRLPMPLGEDWQSVDTGARASATPRVALPESKAPPGALGGPIATIPRTLRDVQAWTVLAVTGSEADAVIAAAIFTGGPRLSARDRFEIYRFGYRARLVECLHDDYPIVAKTLGESAFDALCEAYIARHPSSSPNLNAFGRHLSDFCRHFDVDRTKVPRPFLSELAALEWTLVEAIHAELPDAFDFSALQSMPVDRWASARLVPSTAVRLLRFEYPVNRFYQACRERETIPGIPRPAASATAVYRRGLTLWRMDLTPAMTRVLDALLAEESIGNALMRIGVDESDTAAVAEAERSVMVWFREWVDAGFFAGIRLPAE